MPIWKSKVSSHGKGNLFEVFLICEKKVNVSSVVLNSKANELVKEKYSVENSLGRGT